VGESLWDVADTAKFLKLNEARVYDGVRQGLIPAVRIGRQVRFDPVEIRAWVKAGGRALPGGWRRDDDQRSS
jgi:excisionase family DNA binding protein